MKNFFYILLLGVFIFCWGCTQIKPEEPEKKPFATNFPHPISTLSSYIELDIKTIEKKVNEKVKKQLYKDDSFENKDNDNLKISVERPSPIDVSASGNAIFYAVPLKVYAEVKKFGMKHQGSFNAVVNFRSVVDVGSDWKVTSKTQIESIRWVEMPFIKVAGIKINIADFAEKQLRKREHLIEQKIDEVVYEQIDLKKILTKLWKSIQKPIRINKKVKEVWIQIVPKGIAMSKIMGTHKKVGFFVKIDAFTQTLIGEKPDVKIIATLPRLDIRHDLTNEFEINLYSEVYYKELNELLQEKLVGKKLPIDEHEVKIKEAEVSGNGENLVLRIKIKGDSNGTLYLNGKPDYDTQESAIVLKDIGFDVHTEEILLKTAQWIANEHFKEEIQKRLKFSLATHIDSLPMRIQSGLEQSKTGEKIDLHLSDFTLSPQYIGVAEESLKLLIKVKGKSNIKVDKL